LKSSSIKLKRKLDKNFRIENNIGYHKILKLQKTEKLMNILKYFKLNYPNKDILFTNSGRSSLQAVIEDFNLKNSSIILPAFICYDVFSSLLKQNNINPILIDCPKNSFNITLKDIKKAYDKNKKNKIKSVLIVHTFGKINKDREKISNFCKKNKLVLIEDCAHILNLELEGDAAIFSFNKITNLPIGGAYIKNKGKINVKTEKYKLNNLDIYRILNSNILGKFLIKLLKFLKTKENIRINPERIKIMEAPRFINLFTLKKKLEIVPMLIENRDKIFYQLVKQGKRVEKYWFPIFPGDYPNAKKFSGKIICKIIEKSSSSFKFFIQPPEET